MRDFAAQERMLRDWTYQRCQQEAEGYIIKQLGQMRKPDDVATDVAFKFAVDYNLARQLVNDLAKKNKGAIHMRRIPLILLISATTLFGGVALIYSSAGTMARLASGEIMLVTWGTVASLGTGLAMVVGSIVGFASTFSVGSSD